MAANENQDDSLYPIAVLIDELRNEDVQVCCVFGCFRLDWLTSAKVARSDLFISEISVNDIV